MVNQKDDEWFEEICWICQNIKLVHNDEKTSLEDPGFICEECENKRNERMREFISIFGSKDEQYAG